METDIDNLEVVRGYSLLLAYQLDTVDITNYGIKLTIYNCMPDGEDYQNTDQDGVEKPNPLEGFFNIPITTQDTENFNQGTKSYNYVLALKAPGEDWKPFVQGRIKVIDPNESYE